MGKRFPGFAVAVLLAATCCLTACTRASAPADFSPHDIDGLWMTLNGKAGGAPLVDPNAHPPFTAEGQKKFDATFPSLGPRDIPGKENDPILQCYPDGFPKMLGSPHPFEMFTLKDRVIQLFEKEHNWRIIWTDGKKHNEGDDPTYNGHATGNWDGDTFVVESSGFIDIPWLDYYGDPLSESMKLTEYYKRVDKNTLTISATIDDPKMYTAVWVGKPHNFKLEPDWALQEYFCINNDLKQYDTDVRFPSGAKGNATPAKTSTK